MEKPADLATRWFSASCAGALEKGGGFEDLLDVEPTKASHPENARITPLARDLSLDSPGARRSARDDSDTVPRSTRGRLAVATSQRRRGFDRRRAPAGLRATSRGGESLDRSRVSKAP